MILVLSLASALTVAVIPAPASRSKVPVVADSGKTVKYVRSAQASFESFRRSRLPYGESGYGRDCDVRGGRLCYWREEDPDDDKGPEPEAPAVRDRRTALIRVLDSVAQVLPG